VDARGFTCSLRLPCSLLPLPEWGCTSPHSPTCSYPLASWPVGHARLRPALANATHPHCPPRVAPEVLLGGRGCTSAVDIFSMGVVLWVRGGTEGRSLLDRVWGCSGCGVAVTRIVAVPWGVTVCLPSELQEIVAGERPQRGHLRPPRVPEECPQVGWGAALCLSGAFRERPWDSKLCVQCGACRRTCCSCGCINSTGGMRSAAA